MIIGIDFDNTLADYTGVFYKVGRQLGWLPDTVGESKKSVKSYFMDRNEEPVWTELQGHVYGKEIGVSTLYAGAAETIKQWVSTGIDVHVISHKTRYPVIGEKVSLHEAAMNWLLSKQIVGDLTGQIPVENVHFNETREEKIRMINDIQCDIFIDDLPAVFGESELKLSITKILFDPDMHFDEPGPANLLCHSWGEIERVVSVC